MGRSGIEEANEHDDASASMDTGIHGQSLNISGWFASHADTGRPGPHVRLGAYRSTMRDAVLKTSQIPELIDCLNLVAERIDRQWERDRDEFLKTFPSDAPDPNDPAVIRRRRIEHLELNELVAAHITEVVELVVGAADIHEASDSVAALLDVDPMAIQVHLLNHSLFGLTRDSRAAQDRKLGELRDEGPIAG
ncbi:hypothetical protein [Nocardioides sp. InS609-2]|uniref:hypothetical protein n=1 Tax=Nocardioides sp. InS609-2 TaxID=2760705 RepID=UPI0020BF37DC|nr:hypothetical protein [Nocardioides sp. InS609-2]